MSYRIGHHSTSDDSTRYRSAEEIEFWRVSLSLSLSLFMLFSSLISLISFFCITRFDLISSRFSSLISLTVCVFSLKGRKRPHYAYAKVFGAKRMVGCSTGSLSLSLSLSLFSLYFDSSSLLPLSFPHILILCSSSLCCPLGGGVS